MSVHNHGPSEGRGLDCGEALVDGELKGWCLREPDGTNSEARKRAAEKAVEALNAEVARDVAADYDAEISRVRDKAAWWEWTCEYWHDQTQARDRLIALSRIERDQALRKLAAVAAKVEQAEDHGTEDESGEKWIPLDVLRAALDHSEAS